MYNSDKMGRRLESCRALWYDNAYEQQRRLSLIHIFEVIIPCRRSAAPPKPHVLRFCMVQCSQSPVRCV